MRHEDILHYQHQVGDEHLAKFGTPPQTDAEKITELRREVDSLAGRIKAELLEELRLEIERVISMEVSHVNH